MARYNQTNTAIIIHVVRVTLYAIMYAQCSRGDASWNIGRKRNSARDRNCVFAGEGGGEGSHKDDDNVRDPGSIYRPIVEISFAFSPLFAQFRTNRRLYARIDTALRVIACY